MMNEASPVKKWIWLDSQRSLAPNHDYSYPVHHSFGRGNFRDAAEKVVVPKMVLDKIIGSDSSGCWTEAPCGYEVPAEVRVGGSGARARMRGVSVEDGEVCRLRGNGRARALHIRANKAAAASNQQLRRPGPQVSH